MLKFAWLRNLIVPLVILFIFVVCFSIYYLYWVPDRQRHLDDRGFRYLSTLSDQIRLTLNTYDKMMDYAVDAGVVPKGEKAGETKAKQTKEPLALKTYLERVEPSLQAVDREDAAHVISPGDYRDPPMIAVQADEGTHFLYLAFHSSKGEDFALRTDLDKLIQRLLGPPELSPFDVLLVSRNDGKVIFQRSISGVEVAQIKSLEEPSVGNKADPNKPIDVGLLSAASYQTEVKIAGALYRLYSQPVQIGFLPAHPEDKEEKKTNGKTVASPPAKSPSADPGSNSSGASKGGNIADDTWILCGLVRADRFRAESQLIPYNYILLVFAVIVLAGAAYPLLKLHLSSPGERMLARDVTIAAIFVCLVTVVLTFLLVDLFYWKASYGPSAEREMAGLGRIINANFNLERQRVRDLLNTLEMRPELTTDIPGVKQYLAGSKEAKIQFVSPTDELEHAGEPCTPASACKTNVLNDDTTKCWFETYPQLLFVAWSDQKGEQLIKWTTRKYATPFILLDESSAPYYGDVMQALDDNVPVSSRSSEGIGSQYSPTTGQNITVFWKVKLWKPKDSVAAKEEKYLESLVTQPISLYGAVLPGGYQFAVLTPDGTVVFHSDYTRNLRENFFAETDKNPSLLSRVKMHAEGPVDADYLGRPHRMYVLPMNAGNQNGLWSLVIFRDYRLEETMNLEIVSLVSIIFSCYAGAIVLMVVLVVYWRRKCQIDKTWFWPDSRNADRYVQMIRANLVMSLLLLLLSRYLTGVALLFCASITAAAVVLLNIFVLGGKKSGAVADDSSDGSLSRKCQIAYFAACVSLLIAICTVPCLCYFEVACNFEQKLFVQHQQLLLAKALQNRDRYVSELYQTTYLDEGYRNRVLARPEEQHIPLNDPAKLGSIVYSYHEFLQNRVCNSEGEAGTQKPSGGSSACQDTNAQSNSDAGTLRSDQKLPACVDPNAAIEQDRLLGSISLPYSERFADEKHLAESNREAGNAFGAKGTPRQEGAPQVWKWTVSDFGKNDRVMRLVIHEADKPIFSVASLWTPFQIPLERPAWWLWLAALLMLLSWFVSTSLKRIFLLYLAAPEPLADPQVMPGRLISDLPVNLLIIGPESREPIAALINRSDVQSHEAEELLLRSAPPPKPETSAEKPDTKAKVEAPSQDELAKKVERRRPLVLRHFERLPDDEASATAAHASLLRLQSIVKASVIIISSIDTQTIQSIEASERWRTLLRTYVRIDLDWHSGRRKKESEEEYQRRLSKESYYHWLISSMSRNDKLVLLQLAQERVVNPNSSEIVYELMEQGMIERRLGLLEINDEGFATVLQHAFPRDTVRHWEKDIAQKKQFSLQTIMAIVGLGVIGFLAYTQGEIFNTWVTYAAGVATTLPKIVQFIDNFRPGKAKS
jgi:hypothetical protein